MSRSYLTRLTFALVFLSGALLVGCKSQSQSADNSPTPSAAAQTATGSAMPVSTPVSTPVTSPTQTEAAPVQAVPTKASQASAPPATPAPVPASTFAGIPDVDPHKTRGSKSAPIIMETFSDFQCPACKQLYMGTSRQLNDNYVATGKVFAIHRDFPLPGHAYSRVAARYGRAAAQLGRLEQVEQALFENQEKWEQTGDVDGTVASVLSPADMTKIRALIKNPAIDAAIEKDLALGRTYAVNQTPTTIIHYKGQTYPVVGIVSYDVLHQFLDQLLRQ
ncbi:MAG TPA: thioredoxin domain-containing protein [Candidatus Angelobacter sp.]|nr:thioredoxin domain-containing protein [Candidatus Angelobacter sp.]